MKLPSILPLAIVLSLPATAIPALASTPVNFAAEGNSQAAAIVDQVYGNYIATEPSNAKVEIALVDLDHNNMAAIAVRFDNPQACDPDGACHTTILAYEKQAWHEVFGQKIKSLAIDAGPANVPAELITDGHVYWQAVEAPNGVGVFYYPQIATYTGATPVVPDQTASPVLVAAANAAFFPKTVPSYIKPQNYEVAPLDLGGQLQTSYAIIDDNPFDCGDAGCPFAIVDPNGVAILTTRSHGLMTIGQPGLNGVHDVTIAGFSGLDTYSWDPNGLVYRLSATSYPSKVTPIP